MSILAELESLSPYEPIDAEPEPANDVPVRRRRGRQTKLPSQWFEDWRCSCPECVAQFPERAARAAERSARAAVAAKKARRGTNGR